MGPTPPKDTRAFFEPLTLREWVKDYAKDAFEKKLNKLETDKYKLKVSDLGYDGKEFSLDDQKHAILDRRDVTVPLRGTFQLVDKETGEVVDKKKTIIAHIPYITERNTIIINGSEYIPVSQQRLKAGVYTRLKESGEAEAHVNVLPGTGMGGRIIFHPEKELFMYDVQGTKVPLYGILKDMGTPDHEIENAWGTEIYLKNKARYEGNEIDKLHHKIFPYA